MKLITLEEAIAADMKIVLKKRSLLVPLLLTLPPCLLLALTAVPALAAEGFVIDEMMRPCEGNGEGKGNKQFALRYKVRRQAEPTRGEQGKTLFVYLPGGPGLSSMSRDSWPIPEEFSAVLTDPRGTGVNFEPRECDGRLRLATKELAEDVIAIVRKEGAKRVVLFGVSYGTAVATVAASILEQESELKTPGMKLDLTLILEGAVGRALAKGEYTKHFKSAWSEIYRQLPVNSQRILSGDSPLGYPGEIWGSWIEERLAMGGLPKDPSLETFEALLATVESTDESAKIRAELSAVASRPPLGQDVRQVFRQIGCHEMVPWSAESDSNLVLRHGLLEDGKGNFCAGEPLDNPFDVRNWSVNRTEIVYFVGAKDPVTPGAVSQYHIDHSGKGPKTIIRVKRGGHNPLQVTMGRCAEAVLSTIALKRESRAQTHEDLNSALKAVVESCGMAAEVTVEIK